jgi:Ca2+-binding EF-hand superfamily protein
MATAVLAQPALQPSVGSQVEERLRRSSQTGRIRFSEFFKDYDPLKSGDITKMQFCRCLDQHLSLRLSEADYDFLVGKYGHRAKGTVNYRAFCNAMENAFDPTILDGKPEKQIEAFQMSAMPAAPQNLPPDTFDITNKLLEKCYEYYKYHGINVKSCYCDFDRHHHGLVTQSQFHRSFPGPPDVTSAEVDTLAHRYFDPTTGLYNYLQFHNDILTIGARGTTATVTLTPQLPSIPKARVCNLDEIFGRIRDAVYKNGIRTTEFFRDHDKLRSGVITENQFICGLSLCCGRTAHLSREDIQAVVNHHRNPDGRVRYKDFCDLMENAYNEPDLERKPTTTVYRPLRGHLSRRLNVLASEEDERRVQEILARLKVEVSRRRLLLYPYFRDFDRGKGYTRGVTKPQFERLLGFLSLSLTPDELKLVVRKFEDPMGGDVNYPAFIQAIDEEYTGQTKQTEPEEPSAAVGSSAIPSPEPVDLPLLLSRLRDYVRVNRIRGSEFFQDSDPLRSGSIAASRFRQGLSSLGQPSLTDGQFSGLCSHYADPKHKGNVLWKKFISDIEQVPSDEVPLPRPGAVDFATTIGEGEGEVLEKALHRMSERVQQRRVLTKPCFQDFDKHHNGYVTCSQFRQCLSYLGLTASDQEIKLMEIRFGDSKGVNYLQFLEHLQPTERLEDKYQTRMAQLSTRRTLTTPGAAVVVKVDAESVLEQIKTKVMKERVRVLEFMRDYDKLRSGRIPATSFRRALDLCGLGLGQEEVTALEKMYQSPKDPTQVEYTRFSDEIESVFTRKDLEKTPTAEVVQFVPPVGVNMYVLSPEEEQTLQKTMHRLAERVRVRRIQIFPLFEDYDRVHIGSVTRSQFHRVLSELEMGGLVNAMEFQILYRKFDVRVGGRNDVNYISFCQMIDDYAQTRWSDPALK